MDKPDGPKSYIDEHGEFQYAPREPYHPKWEPIFWIVLGIAMVGVPLLWASGY